MSEANILNATPSDPLNPDMPYPEGRPELYDDLIMDGGDLFTRQNRFFGRIYELVWSRRSKATMHTLRQWEEQYRRDFFTFIDHERTRRFSGRLILDAAQKVIFEGNEQWTVRGRFIELVGKVMNTYPSDWTRDANFLEERDGSGTDLFTAVGTWTFNTNALSHGGFEVFNANTNTTDYAEIEYFGYGCRLWGRKANNLGIGSVRVVRARDGVVVAGPTNVDYYNSSALAAAALFTAQNLPLDRYFIRETATNTKNASSSNNQIPFDAVEVMR